MRWKFQSAPAFIRRENTGPPPGRGPARSFNPLPPLSGGRTIGVVVCRPTEQIVSIRSRLYQAGELSQRSSHGRRWWFQSAPAFIRRENPRHRRCNPPPRGFNPLPPLSGGRTAHRVLDRLQLTVSIRSRLYQAGELALTFGDRLRLDVSIRSRLYQAGEHPRPAPAGCCSAGFNPLPPLSGGRTPAGLRRRRPGAVSIRSRLYQAGELS